MKEFISTNNLMGEEMGYLGDDLNDLQSMMLCGFVGCPRDACREVKEAADYVSYVKGGYGAVRDIIAFLLNRRGEWESSIREIYGVGI